MFDTFTIWLSKQKINSHYVTIFVPQTLSVDYAFLVHQRSNDDSNLYLQTYFAPVSQ